MSFNTAVSGLVAFQKALATTSHNIANVSTEGYSRQRVDLSSKTPGYIGNAYIGKGVNVVAVERSYDQFLQKQVTTRISSQNESDIFYAMASRLDTLLADSKAGLSPAMHDFFNSVQDVANNPSSTPARQALLSQAESLTTRFHTLNEQIEELREGVNTQLSVGITEVNGLAQSISELNQEIARAVGAANGGLPNDLLDQRDVMVEKLATLTNVTTSLQGDYSMNVYVGTGQALVLGNTSSKLQIISNPFDASEKQVALVTGASVVPITEQLTGGKIGGLIDVREEVLNPTQSGLGRVAVALSSSFNTQHQLGDDLNGTPGGLFFTDVQNLSPTVLPNSNNAPASGNLTVTIDSISDLEASDYQVRYDGANFSVQRLSDLSIVDSGFGTGGLPRTIAAEGITIGISGTVAAGDSFLVRPTRNAARQVDLQITDPAAFAVAASGTALGNNENALALTALQTQPIIGNGTASFQDAFGEVIADVGVKTNQAQVTGDAQKALLNQALEARSRVTGVNLDEEAANLLKYQQAYQASAQVVNVINSLFQTLLGAVS